VSKDDGYDREAGVLRAPMATLEALLARSGDAATEEDDPRFRQALVAAARPRCRLTIDRRGGRATCWIDRRGAALLVPRSGARGELCALDAAAVPAALAALLELSPRPSARAPLRLPVATLATLLAGTAGPPTHGEANSEAELRAALTPAAVHWRIESRWTGDRSPAPRVLEAIDSGGGQWSVRPAGDDVLLEPATTGELWRGLAGLFPRAR